MLQAHLSWQEVTEALDLYCIAASAAGHHCMSEMRNVCWTAMQCTLGQEIEYNICGESSTVGPLASNYLHLSDQLSAEIALSARAFSSL